MLRKCAPYAAFAGFLPLTLAVRLAITLPMINFNILLVVGTRMGMTV